MVLRPGSGWQEVQTPQGEARIDARWQGGRLKVRQVQQRQSRRGSMKIEQEQWWELSQDGQALTHTIKMKTPRGSFEMTLVFDRQP